MDKIAAAFVKAQQEFGPALKTSTNPHFKSRYADLAACIEAVIDALNANGIAMFQKTGGHQGGVTVETIFLHTSGETFSSGILTIPSQKADAQGYGSALTYARRYSLMAACGIAPEDDDGNGAKKEAKKPSSEDKEGKKNGVELPDDLRISGPAEAFKRLTPEWQDWLRSFAAEIDNTAEQLGAPAAAEKIAAEELENDVMAGLYSLLSSKTRSALKRIGEAQRIGNAVEK